MNVIHFPTWIDASETPIRELREQVRQWGWEHGFRLDTRRYREQGRVFIRRLTKREVG